MGDLELFKLLASAGGASAVVALVMFYVYRQSVETLFKLFQADKKATEDGLIAMRKQDHELEIKHIEAHDANTRAQTELITLIRLLNGRLKAA